MSRQPEIQVIGGDELAKVMKQFIPRVANNLMRATVHGIAGEVSKEAKKRVPKRTGNLRKSIKAKRRRGKPGQPVSDVIAESGSKAKHDGFYWRFVEYGTQTGVPEQKFMRPARDLIFSKMPTIVEQQFKKKLIAAVNREKKRRAKK